MSSYEQKIQNNVTAILHSIQSTATVPIRVVAVTKYAEVEWIKILLQSGITDIAENQVQQAVKRYEILKQEGYSFNYHFIGPIQTNKISQIVRIFDWVQTISRQKEIEVFDYEWQKQNLDSKRQPINSCIQINIGQEPQKNGVLPEYQKILELSERIINSESLNLRGLMTIPPVTATDEQLYEYFDLMNTIYHRLSVDLFNKYGIKLDTLSMGMSNDYLKAIAHGSTCVRIGTAFFTGL